MFRGSSKSSSNYTGPDFFWQDPSKTQQSNKNYISDNMKKIRAVSSFNKNRASTSNSQTKFIPGVTGSNPKYAHVQSKIGDLIKGSKDGSSNSELRMSKSSISFGRRPQEANTTRKPVWGGSAAANNGFLRPSKSTTDLSDRERGRDPNAPIPRPRLQRHAPPPPESVYNWRFTDINGAGHASGISPSSLSYSLTNQELASHPEKFTHFHNKNPAQLTMHRVEYVPCDGICADEVERGNTNANNGDSGLSSGRSSRGVNTEETRIYPQHQSCMKNLAYNNHNGGLGNENGAAYHHHEAEAQDRDFNFQNQKFRHEMATQSSPAPRIPTNYRGREIGQGDADNPDAYINRISKNLEAMKLNGSAETSTTSKPRAVSSMTSLLSQNHRETNAKNLPHHLGEIPKYLKNRQEEWKADAEAKKRAAQEADIPYGHMLMSETERAETLAGLRANYQQFVNELNRIPISMDTVRIRERRTHIEAQLDKIEQAIKVFSRPRVFVKIEG